MAKKEEEKTKAVESDREQSTAAEKSVSAESGREKSETAGEKSTAADGDRQQSKAVDEKTAAAKPTADKPAEPEKPAEPDWKTLYALTLADFDNYKKRAARDREDVYRYAESDILKDVLPAVDNLALALANANAGGPSSVSSVAEGNAPCSADGTEAVPPATAYAAFVKGVQLVYDTLLKSLKDHGAEPFDSVGKDLDTEKMEAIATLPSEDVEEGKVSIESKRGWMLKDKVLRAAQVVVSSGKPQ